MSEQRQLRGAPGEGAPEPEERPALIGVAVALAGIALLALLVFMIEPLHRGVGDAVSGNTRELRSDLRGLGLSGALIVLLLGLVHVVVWYPAEILDAAVGFVYDFGVALGLIMFVWLVNGLVAYSIGRHAARPLLHRFISRRRFERLEALAERGGVTLLIGMRLVPIIPFSLFSYVAGAARVPLGRFVWTTIVGYLPITVVFVYLGSRLEELSPTDPILWGGAAVLIALLAVSHRVGRMVGEHDRAAEEATTSGAPSPRPTPTR